VRNDLVYVYVLKIDRFIPKVDAGENLRGDLNHDGTHADGDGSVTALDALMILQAAGRAR